MAALFAWLFLVLVILPRRRHEAALEGGDTEADEHEDTRTENSTTDVPKEPNPASDDGDLAHDGSHVQARPDPRPDHDFGAPTHSALTAVPGTRTSELDAQRGAETTFKQHDGEVRPIREHDGTTRDPAPADSSPDVRDELLRRLLDALDAHASLDPKPVARLQTSPSSGAGTIEPQLGVRSNLRALWRFRWLMPIAVCAAILVPLLMLYRPHWPLGLEERAIVSYVTRTQLLVDSRSGPFLRTETKSSASAAPVKPGSPKTPAPTVSSPLSDTKSLVDAANLFPLLMESDQVSALRRELIGNVPGSVHATAMFATQGANRFRPSVLPVMQIIAVAPTPESAAKLGRGTAWAFKLWLAREQQRAKVPTRERIVVRPLREPSAAQPTGGKSYGLPILAGLAVFGAFIGLVVGLDRVFPRVRREQDPSSVEIARFAPSEPQAANGEDEYLRSLERINETLREARAGSRPG